jgi:hypothetical protein
MAIFGKPFFESKSEDVEGVYSKGVFCLQNNDLYKANDYFKQASAKGHISAMYNLSILNGSGSISPYDIDFAVECFRQAAAGEHPNAKQLLIWLQKADDTSLGIDGLVLFASKLPAHNNPNHVLMMAGCRFYRALCERYRATNAVIKYELDAANSSEYDYVHNFIKRTGISRITYEGGLNSLEEGSAAYQITDSLNSLHFALKQSGYSDHLCIMIRCTIVGYIISKSTYSSNAKPMLGVDKFFE